MQVVEFLTPNGNQPDARSHFSRLNQDIFEISLKQRGIRDIYVPFHRLFTEISRNTLPDSYFHPEGGSLGIVSDETTQGQRKMVEELFANHLILVAASVKEFPLYKLGSECIGLGKMIDAHQYVEYTLFTLTYAHAKGLR